MPEPRKVHLTLSNMLCYVTRFRRWLLVSAQGCTCKG